MRTGSICFNLLKKIFHQCITHDDAADLMTTKHEIKKNIIKECFWDYHVDMETIDNIVCSDDHRLKKKLFTKILQNSSDRLLALQIFTLEELGVLFDSLSYDDDSINILRNIILGEKNNIAKLKWKKR